MSLRGKVVYGDGWVRANGLNKSVRLTPCEKCRKMTCATGWYHLRRKTFRCLSCYDAEREHSERQSRALTAARRARTAREEET